ncbi:MAG: hypothetical protein QOE65_1912 [Solirubrobacteraceae bacterium]|nr:hypothetical protein [Solirubrobacteraceae bacterium]
MILCGSGGWVPTAKRETCCALVRQGDRALLVDAGTGVSRLVEDPALLDGVARLDVVLTHFHLDHVVGLAYLPALDLPEPPVVHGPGRWLYDTATRAVIEALMGPPLLHVAVDRMVGDVHDFGDGDFTVGPFAMSARRQDRHSGPTAALRIGDDDVYCTDTAWDPGNADLARGARVLLHEAWHTDAESPGDRTHSSARDAARVAEAAGVQRLVLIHIHPRADEAALLADASSVFPRTSLGVDLGQA